MDVTDGIGKNVFIVTQFSFNTMTYLNGYGCYCGLGGSGSEVVCIDKYVFIVVLP